VREGGVVRWQQGDYSRQLNYDVDPVQTAKQFAVAGAKWMHIVDLDGAKRGMPVQTTLIGKIIEGSGLSVQAGGGIRSTEDVYQLLAAGAERVVVGTKALEDWEWFDELVDRADLMGKIVLALDAKEGIVATRGWTASSGKSAVEIAKKVGDWPLAGILYTDVAKDGMMSGPNYEQTRKLAEAGKVAVIASGGVGNIQHIRRLKELPIWGVIVGRSLYEGALDLREALAAAR